MPRKRSSRTDPAVRRPAEAARVAARVRCARRSVRQRARTHDVRVAERTADARDARDPGARRTADRSSSRGRVLTKFMPFNFTALKTAVPAPDDAYGEALRGVGRRGKYLLLDFGDDQLRDPPHAGRPAARRHQAEGEAPRRPGTVRVRADRERRRQGPPTPCSSPNRAPNGAPGCGASTTATMARRPRSTSSVRRRPRSRRTNWRRCSPPTRCASTASSAISG